jgi:hypothetical protein
VGDRSREDDEEREEVDQVPRECAAFDRVAKPPGARPGELQGQSPTVRIVNGLSPFIPAMLKLTLGEF